MLYKLLKDYPVVALHNRYLGLDTREEPPKSWGNGVYAPYDFASNGTWIGINRDGLLMAITNQETQTIAKPGRSRGLLALDVLRECASSNEARDYLNDGSIRGQYRTGNFVLADSDNAYHVLWDAITLTREIKSGPYALGVITRYPGLEISGRASEIWHSSESRRLRAYRLLSQFKPSGIDDAISKMMEVSEDHEYGKTTGSICWHSDKFRQTSSTILAPGAYPRVLYCAGNHCENDFVEQRVSF
ncbi:hypothetical protein HN807_12995 [Candidatus Bathyarchaeota archaeon]|nr:hypothetical protein [Candidatus Bathyarchaeota archaeon]MBT6603781.1 hypothetical protein [Candidatus Bathyarchaeota archaeon]MBT7186949.1 hypothetical protein [Candidatus Bathyarchaeota archaeon]MBT7347989.1 hypothetical protein [Candidatus Bathyarchaeota archaeon]